MKPFNLLYWLPFFFLQGSLFGQHSLCGIVKMNEEYQENAVVYLFEEGDSVHTDATGRFCFYDLPGGVYTLQAVSRDFMSAISTFEVSDGTGEVLLRIDPQRIEEIRITAPGQAGSRREHSIKTEVIRLGEEATSSVSVEQLMNRSVGIRVRNVGGLGAEADIVVGGFNGKSIKFLIDGIPIDYLGSSMGLTKMPSNMADFVEVYKGVMPTEVGIDALGGAINIVTKNFSETAHNFSYEIGSFNTHRLTLNSFIRHSDKLSYGFNAFMNYTDNDFKVDHLPLADEHTGRTQSVSARLFHNAYKQVSGEAFLDFTDRNWADLLRLKINSYALKRDIQNDFVSRSRPFGGAFREEHAYAVPSMEYRKNLLDEKLRLSQFLVYSRIDYQMVDSVKNARYDWLGNRYEVVSGSEMGVDLSNLAKPVIETRLDNFTYRGLLSYVFNDHHKLILNVVNNYFHRKSDDLNTYRSKTDIDYNRIIAGLGYQYSLFHSKVEALSQIKYLGSSTKGDLSDSRTGQKEIPARNEGWSFAQSFKYLPSEAWLLRASLENTYRLPDQAEIFGDNTFIMPNLALESEKSFNINTGIRYKPHRWYSAELSAYLRNVKNLIRLKEISQFESVFLNLDKVRGYGLELEGMIMPVRHLMINGNLTYNEFRFKGSNENLMHDDHFINARVSNMPFYFGNAGATYSFEQLFTEKDQFQLYWAYSYVHQYYLDFIEKQYEPDGFLGLFGKSKVYTNRIIPVQQTHSVGFIWSQKLREERKLSLSLEVNNIFDHPVFNIFKMQSAGRNISGKITYEL